VILCCLASSGPTDRAIGRIGAVPEDLREGREGHEVSVVDF